MISWSWPADFQSKMLFVLLITMVCCMCAMESYTSAFWIITFDCVNSFVCVHLFSVFFYLLSSNKKLLYHAIWMRCKNAKNFLKPLYDYDLTLLMFLRRLIEVLFFSSNWVKSRAIFVEFLSILNDYLTSADRARVQTSARV